ncbi:MAG: helix-turn-helix transcriptional regulator [Chloroflexi bacterium]|nr:helix-turn-helix transcriptional regulator [Chloroflexota bacterium]
MLDGEPAPGETLADRLDRLFRTARSPRGRPYTTGEAARAIAAAGGPTISPTYLWELRTGRATDPRRSHLQALAAFFGVPCGYFFDDEPASPTSEDPAIVLALRDDAVRRLVGRLAGLSPATVDALVGIVERIRVLEGLTAPGASVEEQSGRPGVDGQLAPRPRAVDGVATGPDGLAAPTLTPRRSPATPSQIRRGPGRQVR